MKVANPFFLSSENIMTHIQQHQSSRNSIKVTVMIHIYPNFIYISITPSFLYQHPKTLSQNDLQYKKHQKNRLTCPPTKSPSLGQFIQYILYNLKTVFKEMTETPQPVAEPPHNLTCQKYRELLNKKNQIIRQQETVISSLKEKIKKTVTHAKNVRENKLYEFYMEKYEQQYQLRTVMEQAVVECISNLTHQLNQIQQTINSHLTDQLRTHPFTFNRKSNTSNLLSTHLSQFPQTQVPMVDSITFGCAAPNKIDMGQALLQLKTKMIYLQTVTEILVTKVEKKKLEQHRDAGIRNSFKEINEELGQLRKELRKQQQINSQLIKQLNIYRNEKQKWRQNFMIVGQAKHVERLMACSKESLVEQIVKLMYCMRIVEHKKQEKERELKEFRAKEKERYEHFLQKIRSQKKIPTGRN